MPFPFRATVILLLRVVSLNQDLVESHVLLWCDTVLSVCMLCGVNVNTAPITLKMALVPWQTSSSCHKIFDKIIPVSLSVGSCLSRTPFNLSQRSQYSSTNVPVSSGKTPSLISEPALTNSSHVLLFSNACVDLRI